MRTAGAGMLRHHATRLVAVALIVGAYGFARPPVASSTERAALATRFAFTRLSLPEAPGTDARHVRTVNPSLQRISAWISAVGAAVALNDLDGDGLPNDVCSVDTRTDQVIVAPAPGTSARYAPFTVAATPLPYDAATMAPMGCLPGDLDEDGRMDLLVYYWGRTPVAFLRHEDRMASAGYRRAEIVPGGGEWYTNAATLADLDGDGHADLVIGNYFPDGSRILDAHAATPASMQQSMARANNGGGLRLLRAEVDTGGAVPAARFAEIGGVLDQRAARGWTLALGAADLDGDLLPEVYIANDFGPDRLLHNRSSSGQFRFALLHGRRTLATPPSSVLGRDSFKGMGVDFGDLDARGLLDIFVSNIADEYALQEGHFAFVNTGATSRMRDGVAPFVNRANALGLARSGWGWDAKLADFDNDGSLDVVQATGFVAGDVYRWPELQELAIGNPELLHDPRNWPRFQPGTDLSGRNHNPFFVRDRNGRYTDIARELGLDQPQVSRGVAVADVDGDGRLDFAVANQWGPSNFYHNDSPAGGSFLGLHLLLPLHVDGPVSTAVRPGHPAGGSTGRPAIGAAVTVHLPAGRLVTAQVDGGNGHSGKRSPDLHIGLGQIPGDIALPVDVRWRDPDGRVHRETLSLRLGWHTVVLGRSGGKER